MIVFPFFSEMLGSISCFGSITVSDAFVDKHPLYIRTAPEAESIVNKEFGVIWVQNSRTALPYLSPTEELEGRKLVFKTLRM